MCDDVVFASSVCSVCPKFAAFAVPHLWGLFLVVVPELPAGCGEVLPLLKVTNFTACSNAP